MTTPPTPAPRHGGTAYVLVHPERFPSNEWHVDDDEYGAHVAAAAALADLRIVVLDGSGVAGLAEEESWGDLVELTVGVPAAGWDVVAAEPRDLARAATELVALLPAGTRVNVGGFARSDCVAITVAALRAAGYEVVVHEEATLPYPGDHSVNDIYHHPDDDDQDD